MPNTNSKSYCIVATLAFIYTFAIGTWISIALNPGGWGCGVLCVSCFLILAFVNGVYIGFFVQQREGETCAYRHIPKVLLLGFADVLAIEFLLLMIHTWLLE